MPQQKSAGALSWPYSWFQNDRHVVFNDDIKFCIQSRLAPLLGSHFCLTHHNIPVTQKELLAIMNGTLSTKEIANAMQICQQTVQRILQIRCKHQQTTSPGNALAGRLCMLGSIDEEVCHPPSFYPLKLSLWTVYSEFAQGMPQYFP
jgi:hypothetical protein